MENKLPDDYIDKLKNIEDNGYNGNIDVNLSLISGVQEVQWHFIKTENKPTSTSNGYFFYWLYIKKLEIIRFFSIIYVPVLSKLPSRLNWKVHFRIISLNGERYKN